MPVMMVTIRRWAMRPAMAWVRWAVLGVVLAGCSGGGSDGGDGSAGERVSTLDIVGRVVSLAPVTGAAVTARAGDDDAVASSGSDGGFLLTLTTDDLTGPVQLTARSGATVLHSVLPSLSVLLQAAGADGRLTRDEAAGVHITHLTTAAAGQVGLAPVSDAERRAALAAIDADRQVRTAAAIALVVDRGVALPDGVADTAALAADPVAAERLLLESGATVGPNLFQSAELIDTLGASDVTVGSVPVDSLALPVTLTVLGGRTAPGRPLEADVIRLRLDAGGTGSAYSGNHDTAITWAVDGHVLDVVYTDAERVLLYTDPDATGARTPIYSEVGLRLAVIGGDRVLAASRVQLGDNAARSYFFGGRALTDDALATRLQTITSPAGQQLAAPTILDTGEVTSPSGGVHADLLRFEAGGSGSADIAGVGFTWTRQAGVLRAAFADGASAVYRQVRDIDGCAAIWLADMQGPAGQRRIGRYLTSCADAAATGFTHGAVPGFYYEFGVGDEARPFDARLRGAGYALRADQSGRVFFDSLVVVDGAERVFRTSDAPVYRAFWNIDADNRLVVDRTYRQGDFSPEFGCTPGTDGCLVWSRATARRLAVRGDRSYWLQASKRNQSFDGAEATGQAPAYTVRFHTRRNAEVPPSGG